MNLKETGKTKIVCTLGPATSSVETLLRMIDAGMDVVRLNFSHGSHEDHRANIERVHEAISRSGQQLTLVQDLQGPKIRVGTFTTPSVELVTGGAFTITTEDVAGTAERVSTTFAGLASDVHPGHLILLDDGKIQMKVVAVSGPEVRCEVLVGGTLSARKGINLPGVPVSAPSFTDKDLDDVLFGISNGVDYIALSFVRSAFDIRDLRKAIASRAPGVTTPIIAKMEKPQAIQNADAIIQEADGVMVARGDLGVEMPPEDVPMLQKQIIRKCNEAGKPVIVATQMLESMISNPRPTRAEASDVANAVVDGCDAVMLSGETSVGKYPVEAVQIMNRIILKAESVLRERPSSMRWREMLPGDQHDAIGRAACLLAEQMKAAAIVAVTRSGETARVLARYRPDPPIIAITDTEKTLRTLNLVWGIQGMVMSSLGTDSDKALADIRQRLVDSGAVQHGDNVVMLAGHPFFARGSTNLIKVERIA
jgi:pyruvate kinase